MQDKPAPATSTSAPAEGFKPVDDLQPQMQSGEMLLVEAYAFIWLFLFALVFFTWRRQRALDRRVIELEGLIARARTLPRPPAPTGDDAKAG